MIANRVFDSRDKPASRSNDNILSFVSPTKTPKPKTRSRVIKSEFRRMSSDSLHRTIQTTPYRTLQVPNLQDDFYLNVVDWSDRNVIAVGVGCSVELWSPSCSKLERLCDFSGCSDEVTSVKWSRCRSNVLAIGTQSGQSYLWDAINGTQIHSLNKHLARVGTLDWDGHLVATGSRDHTISIHDSREGSQNDVPSEVIFGHHQEVCGLRFSPDGRLIASGGNDNIVLIFDTRNTARPLYKFYDHQAAVKALAWSPHERGIIATGGGTADRCIRIWDCKLSADDCLLNCVDTDSQVCNLAWSPTVNEVVSTHGYSLNHIVVWDFPSLKRIATLTGHRTRVLYLAVSPEGKSIVTGAGDETLKFWTVFPRSRFLFAILYRNHFPEKTTRRVSDIVPSCQMIR